MKTTGRSLYWDIFKGLAIIMIVFGHTGHGGAFVYLFHLELFFFVTGFLYNEMKYGDQPFTFLQRRIEGAWPRYTVYSIFLALTHNYMVKHGLMAPGTDVHYALPQMLTSLFHGMIFQSPELLAGPMWFVPVWILGAALFGGVVWLARRIGRMKDAIIVLCALLGMGIGYYFIGQGIRLFYGFELSFFVLPLFAEGYFLRKYAGDFVTKIRGPLALGLLVVSFIALKLFVKNGIWFDLSARSVHGAWFFVGTAIGTIFTLMLTLLIEKLTCGLCDTSDERTGASTSAQPRSFGTGAAARPKALAPLLQKIRRNIGEALAYIGRHSFDVMAFHIFVFKMLDMFLRKLYFRNPAMDLSGYPSPLSEHYWMLYTLVPLAVSVLAGWALDRIGARWKNMH